MKTAHYSDSQILSILKQVESGVPVPELCREHGMSSAPFYKWRAKCGGMATSLMARMMTIRCGNGPEYVSHRLQAWAEKNRIRLDYIQSGKPQQNAFVERYNRTVRYDWLGQHLFENIDEVRDYATKWLWTYNEVDAENWTVR